MSNVEVVNCNQWLPPPVSHAFFRSNMVADTELRCRHVFDYLLKVLPYLWNAV